MGFGYKIPQTRHCKEVFSLLKFWREAYSSSRFFAFSFIFSHFLTRQTPSEDDNSKDERLKPIILEVEGHWAKDLRQAEGFHGSHAGIHYYYCSPFLTLGFDPFESP